MRKNYYFLTKCHKIHQFFDSPIAIYKTHARWRDNHGNGMQTVVPNSFSILNKKSANIIILFKNTAFLLRKRWREFAPHLFFSLPFKFPDWAGFVKFHKFLSTSSLSGSSSSTLCSTSVHRSNELGFFWKFTG